MKRADAEATTLAVATRRARELRREGFTPAAAESAALAETVPAYQSGLTPTSLRRIRRALRHRREWTKA